MVNFKLCRKYKIIMGKGHKKLTKVPSKGIYILIINKIAVIAAKNAPSTIDLVGTLSSNKKTSHDGQRKISPLNFLLFIS